MIFTIWKNGRLHVEKSALSLDYSIFQRNNSSEIQFDFVHKIASRLARLGIIRRPAQAHIQPLGGAVHIACYLQTSDYIIFPLAISIQSADISVKRQNKIIYNLQVQDSIQKIIDPKTFYKMIVYVLILYCIRIFSLPSLDFAHSREKKIVTHVDICLYNEQSPHAHFSSQINHIDGGMKQNIQKYRKSSRFGQ